MENETTVTVNSETINSTVDRVENALTIMAEKLGVASDHFYPVVVKQQLIEGWTYIGLSIPMLSLALLLTALAVKGYKKDGEEAFWAFSVGALCYIAFIVIFGANLTHILNPEYHALMEIKSFIK